MSQPRVLSDADITELLRRLDEAEEARWQRQMESIGYDVSTHKSRAEIHDDHSFVRDLRRGTGRAKMAAFAMLTIAVFGALGKWMLDGFLHAITLGLKGHGGP